MSDHPAEESLPVGVVVRRRPGATRWAKWSWRPVALLPGAGPAEWKELRREGEVVDFHAGTLPLTVHRKETGAYLEALSARPPSAFVVLRPGAERPVLHLVTASPFLAQDHLDAGDEIVERLEMPPALTAWLTDFVDRHHVEERFRKRRRDEVDTELVEDGRGDPRIRQAADVYRSPAGRKR